MLIIGGSIGILVIVLLTLFFVFRGGDDDAIEGFGGMGGDVAQMDPMEAYVQQLIAQGYPEPTARAYAQQYAAHFQQQQQQQYYQQ